MLSDGAALQYLSNLLIVDKVWRPQWLSILFREEKRDVYLKLKIVGFCP